MVVNSWKLSRKYHTNPVLNPGPVVCESITLSARPQRLPQIIQQMTYTFCSLFRHKDDHTLSQSGKHMQKYQGNRFDLRISRVKLDQDKGEYIVRAVNSYGKVEEPFFLKVEGQSHL